MNVYYQPAAAPGTTDRHALVLRIWDVDAPAFDESVLTAGFLVASVDEIKENRSELGKLAVPAPPGKPDWLYIDGGSYQRPDGTVWVPAVNLEKSNLVTKADADKARLQEVRDGVTAANDTDFRRMMKDVTAIVDRIHGPAVKAAKREGG